MVAADQCLDAGHTPVGEIDLGLVVQHELVGLQGPAKDLVLLLQQPDPLAGLTQLDALDPAGPGPGPVIDVDLTHPLEQGHRVNPEVLGDLLDRDTRLPATGDPHHVVTELARVRLRHNDILPGPPSGKQVKVSPIHAADPCDRTQGDDRHRPPPVEERSWCDGSVVLAGGLGA